MKFSFTSSWLLLVLATTSALVVAKKGKKTKNRKNKNTVVPVDNDNDNDSNDNVSPILDGGQNICDPMKKGSIYIGCQEEECAGTEWVDGCEACMCYNNGNASWCDGTKSTYYDIYYKENGKNPFGDSNRDNRKCNTKFSPKGDSCHFDWECESELECTCWWTWECVSRVCF